MHKENEPLQAPVSRYAFQEWANRDRHEDLYVRQASGKVLGFHRYDILPEVYLLFAGDPEHMRNCTILTGTGSSPGAGISTIWRICRRTQPWK